MPNPRLLRFFPNVFSENLIVLALTFRSLIHFNFCLWCDGVHLCKKSIHCVLIHLYFTLSSSLLICTSVFTPELQSWLSSLVVSWEVWVPQLYSFSRLLWLFLVPCISIWILGSVCQFLHTHTKAGIFIETSLKLCINLGVWNESKTVFESMNKGLLYVP